MRTQLATEIRLTPRQRQVCEQLTRGCSDKQISAILGISESTVDFHLRKLFVKFQTHSRSVVAVAYAARKRSLCESVAIGGGSRVATLEHDIAA